MAANNVIATLLIKIGVQTQSLTKGMQKVESQLSNIGKSTSNMSLAMKSSFAAVGAAAAAGLGIAVNKAIDFENQMTRVKAVTNSTDSQFKQLQQTAFKLSNATGESSTKIAESMEKLARFGFDAQKIIEVLPSILDATKASGEGLETVLKVTEALISEFGLTAKDTTKVVDTLSAVSFKTRANISKMGEAFKYSAGTAKQVGITMHDLAATTGLLINAGVEGGMAGRAMRRVMLRLASPTGAAAKGLRNLGVTIDDGSGKMRSMTALIGDFVDKTKKLTKLKKVELINKIFGTEGVTPILALMEQGPDKIKKLADEIEKSGGITKKTADIMRNTARGAIDRFNVSVENLGLQLALTFLPTITKVMDMLGSFVGKISSWEIDKATADKLNKIKQNWESTFKSMGTFLDKQLKRFDDLWSVHGETFKEKFISWLTSITNEWTNTWNNLNPLLDTALKALTTTISIWMDLEKGDWEQFLKDLGSLLRTGLENLGPIIDDVLGGYPAKFAHWAGEMMANFADGIAKHTPDVIANLFSAADSVADYLAHSTPKKGPLKDDNKWGSHLMENLTKGIEMSIPKLQAAANEVASTLDVGGSNSMSSISNNNTVNVYPRSTNMSQNQFTRALNQVAWMRGGVMI
jgi:TP901 family phage tail tape measure protein